MKKSPEISSATFLAFFALNFTKVMTENFKDIHLLMDSSSRSNLILFPNTELGIDLKLMTRKPGRLAIGEYLDGTITRDGEDHFSFIQDDSNKKKVKVIQRNPHVYEGTFININRKPDGTLYPTFNRPRYTKKFTFQDFCWEAANELRMVIGLVEKWDIE